MIGAEMIGFGRKGEADETVATARAALTDVGNISGGPFTVGSTVSAGARPPDDRLLWIIGGIGFMLILVIAVS